MRRTALKAEPRLIYADSSALVKLVIQEAESRALERHLHAEHVLATSRIATVEVPRATALANDSADVRHEVNRLLDSCMLIGVSTRLLASARKIASASMRTLDAIHLASAMSIDADELLAYDRRLLAAAAAHGVATACPRSRAEDRAGSS